MTHSKQSQHAHHPGHHSEKKPPLWGLHKDWRAWLVLGLMLAAMGIVLGILAGVWLGYVLVEGLNVFGYPVHYSFPWSGVVLAFAAGLIMALLAAYLPARSAAGMNIVQALRYE